MGPGHAHGQGAIFEGRNTEDGQANEQSLHDSADLYLRQYLRRAHRQGGS